MKAGHDRLGRLLLRCYPAAWRDRYGDELLDLVSDVALTPRVLIDVAATGLRLRARGARQALHGGTVMTIKLAWRHPTAFAVLGALLLLPTLFVVASSLLAYELDLVAVRDFTAPIQASLTSVRAMDLFLVMAPLLALVAAMVPLLRLGWKRGDGAPQAVITVRALTLNVVVGLVAIGLGGVLVWHFMVEAAVSP